VRKITDGQGADIVVEVGGAGTIAQSTLAVAHRGTISLIGHVAYDTAGMNLLHFTYSGATLRAIGGGSRSDLKDMNRVVPAHRLRSVFDRVQVPTVYEHFDARDEGWTKVVLHPDGHGNGHKR